MEEIEEIMDDEPAIVSLDKIIKELKAYLAISNVLPDIQEHIKASDSSIYMSIGVNKRNMNSRGKFCIALLESGAGSLLSSEYFDNGVIYIHSLDINTKTLTPKGLDQLALSLNEQIIDYLRENNVIEEGPLISEGRFAGYIGTRLYKK